MRIAIVGDYSANSPTHPATEAAIAHAAASMGEAVETEWLASVEAAARQHFDEEWGGFWIAPGAPESLEGVLKIIRYAREGQLPVLGTCGGFQSIVVEYARNVLGIEDAAHEECQPDGAHHVVSRLTCSLVGREGEVFVKPVGRAGVIYGQIRVTEPFRCSYGLNAEYAARLEDAGLLITATDAEGEPRIVEGQGHPFYIGTLFVPQLRSSPERPHPLIAAFVGCCLEAERDKRGFYR